MKSTPYDNPIAAYDRVAAHYANLSRRREQYLLGVEGEIISQIPPGSRSLLDLGAGDGTRALRIAKQSGIERVVLVEPSKGMASQKSLDHAEIWPVRAETLAEYCTVSAGSTNFAEAEEGYWHGGPETAEGGCPHTIAERFDVITCLWNVIGHIPGADQRQRALRAVATLLSPGGRFFLDVNHRYNLRSYGVLPTSARWIRDLFFPSEHNGDVLARWSLDESSISTYGHVFTNREIMRLAESSGLEFQEQIVVDYETGRIRRFPFLGNLLYVFRRSSRMDSSSAPQTS